MTASELGTIRDEERALSALVERAGAAVGAAPPDGDADGVPPAEAVEALREGLSRHGSAAEVSGRADAALRDATERERFQAAEARARSELRLRVERNADEARERLGALAPGADPQAVAADIGALRARIADLEDAERRAAALERDAREAESAAAAQAARQEERTAEEERLRTEAARSRAEARAGAERAAEAERVLLVIGGTLVDDAAAGATGTALDASALTALLDDEYRAREQAAAELAEAQTLLQQARRDAEEAQRLQGEVAAHRGSAALAGALEQELRGNRFIAYVQREAMAVLATDAGSRLEQLTSGRYRLISADDAFTVVDHHNGDEERSVRTLSGGETFLASLALALALAERLPELAGTGAAVSLESLFLDEGFGALDSESLDLAVQGLETLAGGERMIGVVSHVPEIAERLPDRIEVVPGIHGSAITSG